MQNLDILLDMDDASHSLYNAAQSLRQLGLMEKAKEIVEMADKILAEQVVIRKKYGQI